MEKYPSIEDISNLDENKSIIPHCLQRFLKVLYAVRPRSIIPPIPFGLGVEMDHVIGSKWAIPELNRLGFSVCYDEVTRFKQDIVQSTKVEDYILGSLEGDSFTQWIADNVYHNIATIDGKQTFRGMRIVSATTGQFGVERVGLRHLIPCQKLIKAEHVIRNKGVRMEVF